MNMPSNETVDNFLMHHGVKGQKWGVRRMSSATSGGGSSSSPSGARGSSPSSSSKAKIQTLETKVKTAAGDPKTRAEAITAARTAFTVTKYGVVPLASMTGIGLPAIAGLGISVKVFSDPAVQAAIAASAKYLDSVTKDVGSTTLTAARNATILFNPRYTFGVNKERLVTAHLPTVTKLPKHRKKGSGGLFNPKAKIDTSQIENRA